MMTQQRGETSTVTDWHLVCSFSRLVPPLPVTRAGFAKEDSDDPVDFGRYETRSSSDRVATGLALFFAVSVVCVWLCDGSDDSEPRLVDTPLNRTLPQRVEEYRVAMEYSVKRVSWLTLAHPNYYAEDRELTAQDDYAYAGPKRWNRGCRRCAGCAIWSAIVTSRSWAIMPASTFATT